jgi:flagellar export protein FliJ
MGAFRFRAAAALELRRRQEQDAAGALARAQARLSEISEACGVAERQRTEALAAQAEQARHGIGEAALFWHRNWIARLKGVVDDLRVETQRHRAAAEAAERAWRLARRRRMALDRMRERALARHRDAERRAEIRLIDEIAVLRYAAPDMTRED